MFTGNIQGVGKINEVEPHTDKVVQGILFPENLITRINENMAHLSEEE